MKTKYKEQRRDGGSWRRQQSKAELQQRSHCSQTWSPDSIWTREQLVLSQPVSEMTSDIQKRLVQSGRVKLENNHTAPVFPAYMAGISKAKIKVLLPHILAPRLSPFSLRRREMNFLGGITPTFFFCVAMEWKRSARHVSRFSFFFCWALYASTFSRKGRQK